jgi:hypothetical protein
MDAGERLSGDVEPVLQYSLRCAFASEIDWSISPIGISDALLTNNYLAKSIDAACTAQLPHWESRIYLPTPLSSDCSLMKGAPVNKVSAS